MYFRFVLLRKRPTCLKTLCAGAVVASEFVSLLPTIFPGLESSTQEKAEGGATGPGRILWPMCMVLSMVGYNLDINKYKYVINYNAYMDRKKYSPPNIEMEVFC